MKRFTAVLCILFFALSVSAEREESVFNEIASEVSAVRPKLKQGTVAVFPFETSGFSDPAYGMHVSDKLSAALSGLGKLTLVEREKLNTLIREKELSMTGLFEMKEARKIGSLLAVDAMILGRIYYGDRKYSVTVKMVDAQSGALLKVLTRSYADTSAAGRKKQGSGFIGTWRVVTTAPYLVERDMRYEKLVLRDDDSFSLHMINNADRIVEIRGQYRISKNEINYRPLQMFFDGRSTGFKRLSRWLEGTIYLVNGKLYFNYTRMTGMRKVRLDAMNAQYRCVAERRE